MMEAFKKWRITRLRRRAKLAYLAFLREAEQSDCGNEILKLYNPRAAKAVKRFNSAMGELKRIDPEFIHEWVPL